MAETITRLVRDLGLSSQRTSPAPATDPHLATTPDHNGDNRNGEGDNANKAKKKRKKLTPAQKRARDEAAAAAAAPRVSTLKVSSPWEGPQQTTR